MSPHEELLKALEACIAEAADDALDEVGISFFVSSKDAYLAATDYNVWDCRIKLKVVLAADLETEVGDLLSRPHPAAKQEALEVAMSLAVFQDELRDCISIVDGAIAKLKQHGGAP